MVSGCSLRIVFAVSMQRSVSHIVITRSVRFGDGMTNDVLKYKAGSREMEILE